MANVKVIRDWKPIRFFPWIETRELAAFLSTAPNVRLDLVPSWSEWRWKAQAGKVE